MKRMKAAIFVEPGRIELADKPIPSVGPTDALVVANLAPVPDGLTDEQVLMSPDIEIAAAYELFSNQRDGVLKVAVSP